MSLDRLTLSTVQVITLGITYEYYYELVYPPFRFGCHELTPRRRSKEGAPPFCQVNFSRAYALPTMPGSAGSVLGVAFR